MPRPALDCRAENRIYFTDVLGDGELAFAQAPGWRKLGWRSSTVEQLICNQQVVGSSPIASSSLDGAPIYFSLY